MPTDSFTLPSLHFATAEKLILEEALRRGENIGEAAALLGITRHAFRRRMHKHRIPWSRSSRAALPESTGAS